jgi:hypothetical protein
MFDMVGNIIPLRVEKMKMVNENPLGRPPRTRPRDHIT